MSLWEGAGFALGTGPEEEGKPIGTTRLRAKGTGNKKGKTSWKFKKKGQGLWGTVGGGGVGIGRGKRKKGNGSTRVQGVMANRVGVGQPEDLAERGGDGQQGEMIRKGKNSLRPRVAGSKGRPGHTYGTKEKLWEYHLASEKAQTS